MDIRMEYEMKKNKILKLFLLISFILAVAIIIAINFKMNTVKNIRYAIQKNFLGSDETESTTEKPTVNPDPNNIQVYMSCKSYLGSSKHHGKAGYLSNHTNKWELGEIVPCDWMSRI